MKIECPRINQEQLEESYELCKFLELLIRGLHLKESYLTGLKIRFDLVPLDIKIEYIE